MGRKKDKNFEYYLKLKNTDIKITLSDEALKEINEKLTFYKLQQVFDKKLASKLTQQKEINITLKTYYKLCQLLDWKFPSHFKIEVKEPQETTDDENDKK